MYELSFFGVALDPLENLSYVNLKRRYVLSNMYNKNKNYGFIDPYEALMEHLDEFIVRHNFKKTGKIAVDSWLTPKPESDPANLILVTLDNYEIFTDTNGCKEYADKTRDFIDKNIPSEIPVMIGVDHSTTGGAIESLAKRYGKENLSIIILDYHCDFRPPSITYKLLKWMSERKGEKTIQIERPDSYNAGSFILFLIKNQTIYPDNVIILGVVDYPTEKLKTVDNEAVKSYLNLFENFERHGMKIITNSQIRNEGVSNIFNNIVKEIKTPYIYVSFDSDVGVLSATYATRLINFAPHEIISRGLNETQIYEIAHSINRHILRKGKKLAGLDIMETDVYKLGGTFGNKIDETREIEGNFLKYVIGIEQ
jgi:arginase family enzyme